MKHEPWKIREARIRRAGRLSARVLQWRAFAEQNRYPVALQTILETALEREYQLGRRRAAEGRDQ